MITSDFKNEYKVLDEQSKEKCWRIKITPFYCNFFWRFYEIFKDIFGFNICVVRCRKYEQLCSNNRLSS